MALKRSSIITEQFQLASQHSAPASGYSLLYPKSDGFWYIRNASGAETRVLVLYLNSNLGVGMDEPDFKLVVRETTLGQGLQVQSIDGLTTFTIGMNPSGHGHMELTASGRMDFISGSQNIYFKSQFTQFQGNMQVNRDGDGTGATSGQKGSYALGLETILYNGSGDVFRYAGWKIVASTTINMLYRICLMYGTSDVSLTGGTEAISVQSDGMMRMSNEKALAADFGNTNAAYIDVPLNFPVIAGSAYEFEFFVVYTAAVATTGTAWSINGPAGTMAYESQYALTTTTRTNNYDLASYNLPAAGNATSATTGSNIARVRGTLAPTASGTVTLRMLSKVATANSIVAKAKLSYVKFQQTA